MLNTHYLATAALILLCSCGQATSEAAIDDAAATITEADVRARVNLMAADSMGGRDTPSPGLEKTAAYIATEFEDMGLEPLGDQGGWYQSFGVRISSLDPEGSSVRISDGESEPVTLTLGVDASGYSLGAPAEARVSMPLVVVGGGNAGGLPGSDPLEGTAWLWVPPGEFDGNERRRAREEAVAGGAAFLLIASDDDSRIASAGPLQTVSADLGWPTMIVVREPRVREGSQALALAMDEVAASPELSHRSDQGWTVTFETRFLEDELVRVPNVVGLVRGTDPVLVDEFVIITAHFDHVGSRCARDGETDRICNGADDNASGTTGLLELAEAFAEPGAQPRRSMLFVAVSGEERGLWGSQYFAQNPPVPIDDVVANINMDHLGRNWPDSIAIIGGEHSDLGALAYRVAEAHPELNIGPLPDQWPDERIYFRSDHYNFAKEGVPILFFTNGFHEDYHRVTDSPDKIDAEKQARVVRYIFYVAQRIANQDERPSWDPDSFREIVRPGRQSY